MRLRENDVYTFENLTLLGEIYYGLLDLYNHGERLEIDPYNERIWSDILFLKINLNKEFKENWKEQERQIVSMKLEQFLNQYPDRSELRNFLQKTPIPDKGGFWRGESNWKKISKAIYYSEET